MTPPTRRRGGARATRLYLYAIIDRPDAALPARRGFGGSRLAALSYLDIAAVTSTLEGGHAPAASAGAVQRHARIVGALMAACTVLPVRFGTLLPDEESARDLLRTRYPSFAGTLQRVRSRVELGLRVLWAGETGPLAPPGQSRERSPLAASGRGYLMARLAEERRARAARQTADGLGQQIHHPLAVLAAESVRETLPTPRTVLAAAYLVDRGQIGPMRQKVGALARSFTDLRFLLTGPWPPYHFCAGASDGELASWGDRDR